MESDEHFGFPEWSFIPVILFSPNPGDMIIVVNGNTGIVHRLNGPYQPEDLEEVMTVWANEYLRCGDRFHFYYEPLDGGEAITGQSYVAHQFHLN